jgi:hypothetical protein
MQDTNIFIQKVDGTTRQISWVELNQLKKDILWMFDENGNELPNAFVPDDSFTLPYWEYVTLEGGKYFSAKENQFYREGALIVVLCMILEYIDIQGGNQLIFGDNTIQDILKYITSFQPIDEKQKGLKELVISGLTIAASITKEDIARNENFQHAALNDFHAEMAWVSKNFILAYYNAKLA